MTILPKMIILIRKLKTIYQKSNLQSKKTERHNDSKTIFCHGAFAGRFVLEFIIAVLFSASMTSGRPVTFGNVQNERIPKKALLRALRGIRSFAH